MEEHPSLELEMKSASGDELEAKFSEYSRFKPGI